jgi:hypothetical protein
MLIQPATGALDTAAHDRPSWETVPCCLIRNWKKSTVPLYHEFVHVLEYTRAKQLAKYISRNGIFFAVSEAVQYCVPSASSLIPRWLSAFELAP